MLERLLLPKKENLKAMVPCGIMSLHNVQEKHKVTYDSSQGAGFVVHKADGTCRLFMPLI